MTDDLEVQRLRLGVFVYDKADASGASIQGYLEEVMDDYGVRSLCQWIVSDNESAMASGCRHTGKGNLLCVCHSLQLSVNEGLKVRVYAR